VLLLAELAAPVRAFRAALPPSLDTSSSRRAPLEAGSPQAAVLVPYATNERQPPRGGCRGGGGGLLLHFHLGRGFRIECAAMLVAPTRALEAEIVLAFELSPAEATAALGASGAALLPISHAGRSRWAPLEAGGAEAAELVLPTAVLSRSHLGGNGEVHPCLFGRRGIKRGSVLAAPADGLVSDFQSVLPCVLTVDLAAVGTFGAALCPWSDARSARLAPLEAGPAQAAERVQQAPSPRARSSGRGDGGQLTSMAFGRCGGAELEGGGVLVLVVFAILFPNSNALLGGLAPDESGATDAAMFGQLLLNLTEQVKRRCGGHQAVDLVGFALLFPRSNALLGGLTPDVPSSKDATMITRQALQRAPVGVGRGAWKEAIVLLDGVRRAAADERLHVAVVVVVALVSRRATTNPARSIVLVLRMDLVVVQVHGWLDLRAMHRRRVDAALENLAPLVSRQLLAQVAQSVLGVVGRASSDKGLHIVSLSAGASSNERLHVLVLTLECGAGRLPGADARSGSLAPDEAGSQLTAMLVPPVAHHLAGRFLPMAQLGAGGLPRTDARALGLAPDEAGSQLTAMLVPPVAHHLAGRFLPAAQLGAGRLPRADARARGLAPHETGGQLAAVFVPLVSDQLVGDVLLLDLKGAGNLPGTFASLVGLAPLEASRELAAMLVAPHSEGFGFLDFLVVIQILRGQRAGRFPRA